MTIAHVLDRTDHLKPNEYPIADKIRWLSELDGRVYCEVLATHRTALEPFMPYDTTTPPSHTLLVDDAYAELYLYWLFAKIDFMNAETTRFNNDMVVFNTLWIDYANFINRTCAPRQDHRVAAL